MIKALFNLPLLILYFLLVLGSSANAQVRNFDLAFDLDWTLFYPVEKNGDAETAVLPEGRFRMADGVAEVLLKLHRQGHRISIFSGGTSARNNALAEFITRKIHGLGGTDFTFYKILNFEDLTPRLDAAPGARFSDRWRKDLTKVNADLRRVVMVEDIAKFAFPGQEKNIYLLKKTFNFHTQFDPQATDEFDPPNEIAWRSERNKIRQFFENFQLVQKHFSESEIFPALQDLSQGKSLCPRAF